MAIDGGSVEIRFEGEVAPLRRSVEEATEELGKLESAARKVDEALGNDFGTKALKGFDNFSSNAGDAFGRFVDNADKSVLSIRNLGQSLKGIGLATFTAGVGTATGALMNLAQKGIQATDFLETSRVAMAGLTGSIAEGNKAMTEAAKYWQNNPFQRTDVTNATKQLVQFGRTTKDIASDLDILGNVSLSTGMNIADLSRYYARVSASGRAMTIDLEMMSDRGVPIYRELSEALGTTTAGVRELASQGKIDFETFRKAMEGAVNAEAMEAYENTLARQMDRFKGSISSLAGELAGYKIINDELVISENGLEKAWMRLVKTTATALRSNDLKKGMEGLGEALAKVVDKITTLVEPAINMLSKAVNFLGENSSLLLPLLGALAVGIGKLGSSIPIVSTIIAQLGGGRLGGIIENIKQFIRLNPLLTATIGILGLGFFNAMKNSEEFRQTFGSIMQSLGTIAKNLMDAFQGVFAVIAEIIQSLAESGVVQGILQGVASALAWIAQAVASIPPEALATLISFFVSLKLLKANPLYLVAAGIALLVSRIKELGGIGKVLEELPKNLATIGHNMMTGLINGIQEGARKVFDYIKQIGITIVSSLRNILGIHSPSTVMYGIGENITLGLANGIEDSKSAVQVAMNNLAKDILSVSEKVIKNKVDFGILDVKGEYQEWKKVSKLFTQGSEQYNYAIEKMEEARKQANLQILSLQRNYNDALDQTIGKIANMYGLLDDVNLKAGKNASQILEGLDQQVAKLQEWATAQEMISNSGLDAKLIEELQGMGVDATSELSAIANMTADELSTLNSMWLKKQEIANRAGVKQMEGLKNDTLDEINALKEGIDGVTVDVTDVGGRLVEHISEGVYGAMPTLESAFSQLGSYIEKAQRELAKSAGGASGAGSAGAGPGVDVPNAGDEVAKTIQEEIQNSVKQLGDMLPGIIIGGIGAVAAVKFGPKIAKALANKFFNKTAIGKSVTDTVSNIMANSLGKAKVATEGKLAKAAESMAQDAKASTTVAQSGTQIGSNMQTASKGLSKVNSVLNTIIKGAGAVIAIAAAIAAMAGALWVTYNALKDVDFGKLAGQLGLMAAATAVFGVIAGVIGRLPVSTLVKGIVVIIGVAADIALVALACRSAYELMKGVDFAGFAIVIGEMALALVAFGVLAGVMGIGPIALAETVGLLIVAGIALDMVAVATACRYAYDTMNSVPFEDFARVIGEMAVAIGAFGLLTALSGLLAILGGGIGLLYVMGICNELVRVAVACRTAYEVMKPVNWDDFAEVLGQMATAIGAFGLLNFGAEFFALLGGGLGLTYVMAICDEIVKAARSIKYVYDNIPDDIVGVNKKIDLIREVLDKLKNSDLGGLIGSIVANWTIENLVKVIDNYVHIAEQLNKLQDIKLDSGNIDKNLDIVRSSIEQVQAKTDVISAVLQSWADEANASSVENAGRVIKVYGDIVDTLEKLSNVKIKQSVYDGVATLTTFVQGVLDKISEISVGWGVNIEGIVNTVGQAQSVLNKFSEIIPVVTKQIQDENLNVESTNKVIDGIKSIIENILSIKKIDGLDDKENVVGKAQSILNKFTEIVPTIGQLVGQDFNPDEAKKKIVAVRDLIYEIGLINQDYDAKNLQKKADILSKTQSLINKMTELAYPIGQLAKENFDTNTARQRIWDVQSLTYEIAKVNQEYSTSNLEKKAQILAKTQSLINKMTELAPTIKQLIEVGLEADAATKSVQTIRNLVWEIGQINTGDSGNLATKEWVVGMAASIAYKLGEFSHALSTIGSVNGDVATQAINAMNNMFNSIANGMNANVQVFENVGVNIGQRLANGVSMQTFQMQQAGLLLQSSLWSAIESKMGDEFQQGAWMATQFGNGLKSVDFSGIGGAMQTSLWWGIQNRMNDEYWQGRAMGERFRQGLYDIDYGNAGWWAVQGFINGAWGRAGSGDGVYHTGWWIADTFLRGLKDRGGQGSPWKTTLESGNWAMEGLINGLREQESALVGEATTIADEVIDALTMDNLTMSPTLDATALAPSMGEGEYGIIGGNGREVIVNQTNTNYTEYDVEQVQRDLAYALSKV